MFDHFWSMLEWGKTQLTNWAVATKSRPLIPLYRFLLGIPSLDDKIPKFIYWVVFDPRTSHHFPSTAKTVPSSQPTNHQPTGVDRSCSTAVRDAQAFCSWYTHRADTTAAAPGLWCSGLVREVATTQLKREKGVHMIFSPVKTHF